MNACISGIGSSLGFPAGDLGRFDAALARLAALGADCAELPMGNLHFLAGGREIASRRARILDICARHGLRYSVHAPIAINFMNEAHAALHVATLRAAIEFAAAAGAHTVVVHPGRVPPAQDRAERDRLLGVERDRILAAADLAGRHNVRIGMENLNPDRTMMAGTLISYALDPMALAAQLEAINHPAVCGVLDFGHGWLAAAHLGFDYVAALRGFAPFVGHMHVTDNCGRPMTYFNVAEEEYVSYGMGDLHLPIGWGTVPYDALLPGLAIRDGSVMILEMKSTYHEELPAALDAVRALRARLPLTQPPLAQSPVAAQ